MSTKPSESTWHVSRVTRLSFIHLLVLSDLDGNIIEVLLEEHVQLDLGFLLHQLVHLTLLGHQNLIIIK
jgi:hypothetical protein